MYEKSWNILRIFFEKCCERVTGYSCAKCKPVILFLFFFILSSSDLWFSACINIVAFRSDYQQLVYGALWDHTGPIMLIPPATMKPQMLWSGKQVISTLLINLTPQDKQPIQLNSKSKIRNDVSIKIKLPSWVGRGTESCSGLNSWFDWIFIT